MVDIEKIKRGVLASYPLFGRIITNAKLIEQDQGTCGTDGKNIFYNPHFLEKLTEEEQKFSIAHEICHIAFDHIKRSKNKNHKLWNTATDAVINALLKKDGLTAPKGIIDMPDAVNFSAEKYYERLLKQEQKENEKEQKNKEKQNKNNSKEKQDSNNMNSENNKESQNNNSENQNKNNEEKNINTKNQDNDSNNDNKYNTMSEENNISSHDKWSEYDISKEDKAREKEQQEQTKIDEVKAFKANKKEKIDKLKNLKEQLENTKTARPRLPGEKTDKENIELSKIEGQTNLMDWRIILKNNAYHDYDWSFENATIEYGVVTPHLEELPYNETEILLDTSGSVNVELLRNFLRECKSILKDSKISVGCFDTEFYGFQQVKNISDIENLKFEGNGGTDFEVAVKAFSNKSKNKIIFTDGFAEDPKRRLDAVWLVYGDCDINPPGGKVFYIDTENFKVINKNEVSQKQKYLRKDWY